MDIKRTVFCCLVLFLLLSGCSAYKKNFNEGVRSFEEGDYENALKYFSLAITVNPDKEHVYLYRAKTFLKLKQYERAIQDCSLFLEKEKKEYQKEAYLTRGQAYMDLNWYKYAFKDYNSVIALDGQLPLVYRLRGLLLLKIEAFKRAKSDLKYAIKLDPTEFDALLYLSNYYVARKQYRAALKYLEKAVDLRPKSAMAHYLMGKSYLGIKNKALAFEKCTVVNNLNPFLGTKLRKQYMSQKDSVWKKRRF